MLNSVSRRRTSTMLGILLLATAALFTVILVRSLLLPREELITFWVDGRPVPYTLDLDTGLLTAVGQGGPKLPSSARFAPNGQQFVYSDRNGPNVNGEADIRLYLVDADGTNPRQLTSGSRDGNPHWSPDGRQIVFVRSTNFFSALFIVDVASGKERQLTDFANDLHPDWSPDGRRIVFTTSRDGFQELYTMAPDGSDLKRLTDNELQNDLRGVYSPDGSMIAYMTNYSVGDGTGEIWLMNADGSDPQWLTDNKRDDLLPTWSPDGSMIAFVSQYEGFSGIDIFLYDLRTRELRQVTGAPGNEYDILWSTDSQWIGYTTSGGAQHAVRVSR